MITVLERLCQEVHNLRYRISFREKAIFAAAWISSHETTLMDLNRNSSTSVEDRISDATPAPVSSYALSEGRWYYLYRTAAVAALVTVALFLFQIVAFFVWPPPSTVAGHFALLQSRTFIGLVGLDFLISVDEVLFIPICLALYFSLRRVHESLMLIATALSAASITCFLIATPALNMLYLSRQYVAAATGVEREEFLAAGQAVLSSWFGTPFRWAMSSDQSACY